MAEITHVKQQTGNSVSMLFKWQGLANGDSGDAVEFSMCADRSVQVSGTFGVGGKVVVEGSNDGISFYTLTGLQGSDLEFTTGGIEMISEITQYIRPRVTAGDGTTSLNIIILAKGF